MKLKKIMEFADTPKQAKHIEKLLKTKQYDKIYSLYGEDMYSIVVPWMEKKKDIKRLLKDGRFEDIYRKHGLYEYNKLIDKMEAMEVYDATGSKLRMFICRMKPALKEIGLGLLLYPAVFSSIDLYLADKEIQDNLKQYSTEINEYNRDVNQYANAINEMGLTDTQIIAKVMNDIWKDNQYGEPKNDKLGIYRLALAENNVGVCRNMADDFTAKMNAINPKYKAHNLCVYMSAEDKDGNPIQYQIAKIDRHTPKADGQNVQVTQDKEKLTQKIANELVGNHMVSVIEIPEDNTTLIVDPTNPGIGVYKDGKIYMLSTKDGKGITAKTVGTVISDGTGIVYDVTEDLKNSFEDSKLSMSELREKYGPQALNQALDVIKQKDPIYASKEVQKPLEVSIEEEINNDSKLEEFNKKYRVTIESNKINKNVEEPKKTNHKENQDIER